MKYYPTIRYYAIGKKDRPAEFKGLEKSYENIVSFIESQVSEDAKHHKKSDL